MVPVKVMKVKWCWRMPPRCTTEETELRPQIIDKVIKSKLEAYKILIAALKTLSASRWYKPQMMKETRRETLHICKKYSHGNH